MSYSISKSNNKILLFLKGMLMGAADVVPGVSGGTIALLVGIYDELIHSIADLDFKILAKLKVLDFFKKINWKFLVPLFIGILSSIVLLSHVISWLMENQPLYLWSFFFGLVLSSVVFLLQEYESLKFPNLIFLFVGTAIGSVLLGSFSVQFSLSSLGFFMAGAIASIAMILPGISGSYILVLIGMYKPILEAVKSLNVVPLFFVGCGVLLGLSLCSRLLKVLLKSHPNKTYALLFGFILGSLQKIWPWQNSSGDIFFPEIDSSYNLLAFVIMLTSGVIVVLTLYKSSMRR